MTRSVSLLGVVGLAAASMVAPGCKGFDTDRTPPKRGSVGQEVYGVLCDRVGAQALREDLTGASYRDVCHRPQGGEFKDQVDTSKLPRIAAGAFNEKGVVVSLDKQKADRDKSIGRIEALARRRSDLIRALDAAFPEEKIPIKDLDNRNPTKSCDAPKGDGEDLLTNALADMLSRMGELYTDGTLPQSTQSLARVVEEFKKSDEAQKAWARLSGREGYRPLETALGIARPVIAYPALRDLSNASLRLLSADSKPYEPNPQHDSEGKRIPVAGPGNAALNKLLEAAHEELLAVKPKQKSGPLAVTTDAATGRVIISRPRDYLELADAVVMHTDDDFANGSERYIVKRDYRGFARISGGAVPTPLVDEDNDGLPDVDDVGRFKTNNGSIVPSPFSFPNSAQATRDTFDRALVGGNLLYEYVDTSRTFAAQVVKDLKPLVNSDPAAKHETLMDAMGGLFVVMGPRETRSKAYDGKTVEYDGIRLKDSPVLDLIYALGVILADKNADQTMGMIKELFTANVKDLARVTGAMNEAFDIAQKHPEAAIPRTSTFWDESLDVTAKIVKEPGLLEDILHAVADPATQELGKAFANYARFKDELTYDRDDLNGPAYNLTTQTKAGEMKTPVDRNAPITGENRSAMYRFLGLISDTMGVAACNKPDAKVRALDLPLPGTYKECEVFKIDDLGKFYIDSIANAQQYDGDAKVRRGTINMRPILRLTPGLARIIESSSGITGMWPASSGVVAPTPNWLNRLVFFDVQNDTKNEKTQKFIGDLQGDHIGTSICPERIIDDPKPDAPDASPDGKIHGLRNCPDGQWLQDRGKGTLFTLEQFGFYDAIRPLIGAFVKHKREDLFLELSSTIYRHFPGPDASPDECHLANNQECTRENMASYEGLVSEAFATDVFPALSELVKALDTMAIKTCTAADPTTHECTPDGVKVVSGIDVAAAATRAAVDPDYSKEIGLVDRNGNVTAKRNDGTTNPQVTPAYLVTNALTAIDLAFDKYEEQNPTDKERRAGWRRARSQLVDQFLGTTGTKAEAKFTNPSIPKMTPVIVDMVRSQVWAHCPSSFVPPYEKCTWARDELTKTAEDTLGGPLVNTGIDVMDAIRRDPEGRRETEKMMEYLLDAASQNEALANVLASSADVVQILQDDDLLPFYKVLAAAVDGSKYDQKGRLTQKSLVDAQMALLARVSGKYFDKGGKEICSKEVDPNQILAKVLGKLVTPIQDGDFNGQTPLEVLIDVAADVNRDDPTQPYQGTLKKEDYASVSDNVVDFLTNKERGLEQFYEIVRQGTKH